MKEYILKKHPRKGRFKEGYGECGISVKREEFVSIGDDKEILVWQKQKNSPPFNCFVIVPCKVKSEVYKTQYGANAVKCEGIPEAEEERSRLIEILRREGFEGPINFN